MTVAAETEAGRVRFRRRQRYLRRARTFDKLKVLLDEIETEWADSQQSSVSVFNPPRSTHETRHVFRATFGNDHIRFLFVEWSATKSLNFSKAPTRFLNLLSILIKYIIGIESLGRGLMETHGAKLG